MRVYVLYLAVGGLAIYAWRNWFVSCCGLVLLMAIMQHEDMPKTIVGIQGLNPWNILLADITVAWLAQRRRQGLLWDMPRHVSILLAGYLIVVLIGFLRLLMDRSHLEYYPLKSIFSEELINTIKWVVPGVMLYDGCRTRPRLIGALVTICLLYLLLAFQVIRRMPPSSAIGGGGERIHKLRLKTCAGIGYSLPDMSTILAGGFWSMAALGPLCRRKRLRLLLIVAAAATLYGQLLTGGRAGYAAWIGVGALLCLLRWRKALLAAPLVPILLLVVFPGVVQRATQGMGEVDVTGQAATDEYVLTSGRNLIWPHVIEKIADAPVVGYGRLAMIRTGLRDELGRMYGGAEAFPHPHNLYLEWLFDNGFLGAIPVFAVFGLIVFEAAVLFRDRGNPWCAAAGGVCLALVGAQLVAGLGSQHFYPRESTVGMWAAIFLMLRVFVERRKYRGVARVAPIGWERGRA